MQERFSCLLVRPNAFSGGLEMIPDAFLKKQSWILIGRRGLEGEIRHNATMSQNRTFRIPEDMDRFHQLRRKRSMSNPEIGIEFVLTKRNISDLHRLPSLASALEATFIVVTNLLPYSREYQNDILYNFSPSWAYPRTRTVSIPEIILPLVDARRDYIEILLRPTDNSEGISFLPNRFAGAGDCCSFVQEGTTTVTWDGRVSPCVALMHSHTCFILGRETFVQEYHLGNVQTKDLPSLWGSQDYKDFRAKVLRFDFSPWVMCSGCDLADTNQGDCFGNTFPVCGDCLWARGIILCP